MINLLTDTIEGIEVMHVDGVIEMKVKHTGEGSPEVYKMKPGEFYKFSLAIRDVHRALAEHWHKKIGDEAHDAY